MKLGIFTRLLAGFFILGALAQAQTGVRVWGDILRDNGRPAGGASVRVCENSSTGTTACTPLASIYSDSALAVPIAGSIVTADEFGNYGFYMACGVKVDLVFYGTGLTTRKEANVSVPCASGSGGGGAWGDITGTLSDQTDLQAELDLLLPIASLNGNYTFGTGSDFTFTFNAGGDDNPTFEFADGTISISGALVVSDGISTDGSVSATGGFSGPLTGNVNGNASTATALAANPAACTNQVVTDIAADGTLTCSTVTAAELGTDSVSADELNATGVESELEAVLDLQDLQGAVTDAQVPDNITVTLAATATALAANGSNCAGGTSFALGVDASGVGECGTIQNASAVQAGLVSTGSQTFAGTKSFGVISATTGINVGDGTGNDYITFIAEATNPSCGAGAYSIWANSADTTLKKCQNGVITNIDTGGAITGTDTRVMFFDGADTPAGDAGFTYNKTTDSATLAGTITANAATLTGGSGTLATITGGNATSTNPIAKITDTASNSGTGYGLDVTTNTSSALNGAKLNRGTSGTGSRALSVQDATVEKLSVDWSGNLITSGSFTGAAWALKETGGGSDTATLQAPAAISSSYTWTLPTAQAAAASVPEISSGGVMTYDTFTGTGTEVVKSTSPTFITSVLSPIFASTNADVADAGAIRLGNAESIAWEASPAGTDVTISVDSSEVIQMSGAVTVGGILTTAGTITYSGGHTIRSSAGSMTVSSVGSNGAVILSPNGTGNISLATTTGHYAFTQSTPPAITTSCGTSGSIATGGTDSGFTFVVGSGGTDTSCDATFTKAYANAPACVAMSDTDELALKVATTTTTVIVSKTAAFTASSKIHVICIGG